MSYQFFFKYILYSGVFSMTLEGPIMRKSKMFFHFLSYLPLSLSMFHNKVKNQNLLPFTPNRFQHFFFFTFFFTLKNNIGDISPPSHHHHQYFLFAGIVLCVGIIAKKNTDRHTVY